MNIINKTIFKEVFNDFCCFRKLILQNPLPDQSDS